MKLRSERALGIISLGLAVFFMLMIQQWQLTETGVWRSIINGHLLTFVSFLLSLILGAVLISLEESGAEATEEDPARTSDMPHQENSTKVPPKF